MEVRSPGRVEGKVLGIVGTDVVASGVTYLVTGLGVTYLVTGHEITRIRTDRSTGKVGQVA